MVSLEQGSCTHSSPGAQVEVGSFEAGLCCRKGVVLPGSGFWGLSGGVALMSGAALLVPLCWVRQHLEM